MSSALYINIFLSSILRRLILPDHSALFGKKDPRAVAIHRNSSHHRLIPTPILDEGTVESLATETQKGQ